METTADAATTGMSRHPGASYSGRHVHERDADWHARGGRGSKKDHCCKREVERPVGGA